jgi:hypothetical protein
LAVQKAVRIAVIFYPLNLNEVVQIFMPPRTELETRRQCKWESTLFTDETSRSLIAVDKIIKTLKEKHNNEENDLFWLKIQ